MKTAHPRKSTDAHQIKLQTAFNAQDWSALAKICRQVLRKQPSHQQAHRWLGFALSKLHQTQEAIKAYQQAITFHPDDAELLINFGHCLVEQARNVEALPLLERMCKLMPNHVMSWLELANCCYLLGLHEKGFDAACRADKLAKTIPERTAVYRQKAIHRRELGQVKKAVQDCEAAIALTPTDPGSHTNRLLFMLADPQTNATQLAAAAREFGVIFEPPLRPFWPTFVERRGDPWRKLKIGFMSPDFRVHSVMYFVEGLLSQLDRRQFEVIAFYLYPMHDHVTERVQCCVDRFVELAGFSPDVQATMIRQEEVDVLIDLTGHTGHNGLLTMARKPAPVQVSWLGFPATTGLQAIDYKFTDEVTDPPGADDQYTERLFRLKSLFTCYRPMSRDPLWRYQPRYLVRPSPALANGFITFGSCNNLGKLTDEVLTLWGRLLQAQPTARLLIEGKNLNMPDFAAAYRQRCRSLGIDDNRLDLIPLDTGQQYLTYHRIDIALDPFPLTGGTTTFDLLWMGVPLVSMEGDCFKSRLSTGILTHLGQSDWLAKSPEDYIKIACTLAKNIDQLDQIRSSLRQRMEASCLMNEDIHIQEFGNGLRQIWQRWLASASGDAPVQDALLKQWAAQRPAHLAGRYEKEVGIETGKRLTRQQAYEHLQKLLDLAKRAKAEVRDGKIESKEWRAVTEFCETVLCAIPHDPLALACLAEVEHAHGHTNFAVTYLRYAQEAIANNAE